MLTFLILASALLKQLIGAAAAIQAPLKQIKAYRHELAQQNWHRLKIKVLTIIRFGGCLRQKADDNATKVEEEANMRGSMNKRMSFASIRALTTSYREDAKGVILEAKNSAKMKITRWTKKIQGKETATVHVCIARCISF